MRKTPRIPALALFAAHLFTASACDPELTDSSAPRTLPAEEDLGGCANGSCGADQDCAAVDGEAPVPGDPEYASNGKDEKACIPAADANAKLDAGCTFEGGKTAEQAKTAISECLAAHDCFDATQGFTPKEGKQPEHWDRCYEQLCQCNKDVLDQCGGEQVTGLECDLVRVPAEGGVDSCDDGKGNIAIFHGANGNHAVEVTGIEATEDGKFIIDFRDPNSPNTTDVVLVDANGKVEESLSDSIGVGAVLIGCWGFTPATM